MTFLPYHTLPIFTTLLSILPSNVPQEYKFLHPYIRSLTPPARHAIIHTATANTSFASSLNTYVLRICQSRQHYPALIAFWAGVMTEATGVMLDKARSGRKAIQQQNEQDVILRLLPTLNEALAMKKIPDLRLGCYMLLSVLASKGGLDDKLLTAMMEAVVLGWTRETTMPGLVCLSVLAQYRGAKQITKRLAKELLKVDNLSAHLIELSKQRRVDRLANGLCLALVDRLRKNSDINGLQIIEQIVGSHLLSDPQCCVIMKALVLVAHQIDENTNPTLRPHLGASLVALTQLPGHVGSVVRGALEATEVDIDELELKLNASLRHIEAPGSSPENVAMEDSPVATISVSNFSALLQILPKRTVNESSFLSHETSHIYPDLCRTFLVATSKSSDLDSFDRFPILRRDSALEDTLYLTFYMRTWCGPHPVIARTSALQMAIRCLSGNNLGAIDLQAVLPYAIGALGDPAAKVRRAAAELIAALKNSVPANAEPKKKLNQSRKWALNDLYGPGHDTRNLNWLSGDIVARLLNDIIIPALEECVLDRRHIETIFQKSLNGSRTLESPKKQDRLSQGARASVIAFLSSHAVHTPLFSLKMRLLASLNQLRSVASMTRTKRCFPFFSNGCRSKLQKYWSIAQRNNLIRRRSMIKH